jgi:hypothetical protein
MAAILTDLGEEWMIKNNLDTASVDVGLYDDSADSISDTDDVTAINSEPSGGNYTRQTGEAVSASDISDDWGVDNDNVVTFDVTNTSGTVDSYFFVVNFQASDTGDSSANDHLVLTGSLSQSYDLSNLDTLEISAGTSGVTVD